MADQVQDSLLREIDEEIRQEKYAKLWKQFGKYIIAVAVIVVFGVAGYQGWRSWDIKTRMAQSDQFEAALEMRRSGDLEAARNAFVELSDDAGAGYASLARFHEIAILEKNGDRNAAIEAYRQVSEDSAFTEDFQNLAVILGAFLELDNADPVELTARIEPLTAAENPWRFSALEISGLLAIRASDSDKAREIFTQLTNDAATPQGIRGRAAEMLAILG
ncbi:MAG: tetratricopeptide repeat protein [Rhodospirillales bacterium]|nr:tetratricopeptide repeat protein [Rhodospirillales bacterium]